MRLFAYIAGGVAAGLTASYLAWSRTEEGRFCSRMVRSEMAHYSAVLEAERIASEAARS